jgi:hypothetical protein
VEYREPHQMEGGFFVQWQDFNTMLFPLAWDKSRGRFWERKPS